MFDDEPLDHDDDLSNELPLKATSLDKKLPAGQNFGAISRIRGTVNDYAMKVTQCRWFLNVNLGTLQGVLKRLRGNRKYAIGGSNIGLDIGYKQLVTRLKSLMGAHKVLKKAIDTQSDINLGELVQIMAPLERFVESMGTDFGADLRIVLMHAKFCGHKRMLSVATSFRDELLAVPPMLHSRVRGD